MHTVIAHSGSRGIAPLIHNVGSGWRQVASLAHWSVYPVERVPGTCTCGIGGCVGPWSWSCCVGDEN
jgi:hypothetical protein